MRLLVTGCFDCPFSFIDLGDDEIPQSICGQTGENISEHYYVESGPVPNTCPLIKESITVTKF